MLKKVRITNFLSCQDTEIEFDNITALIGRNAAGKSNILKTIEYCAQFAVGKAKFDDYLTNQDVSLVRYDIEFFIDEKIFKYERYTETFYYHTEDYHTEYEGDVPEIGFALTEFLLIHIDGNDWGIIAERRDDIAKVNNEEIYINSEAPLISSLLALLPQKKINPDIKKIFNYLSGIRYYALDNDEYINTNYISGNDYKQWLSKDNKIKSSGIMRLLHLWNTDKELLDEILALLGKNGLNLVDNIIITELAGLPDRNNQTHPFYIVEFNTSNATVNYSQLSYGTQRVLAILLALLYDKNSTLLIEQPEDGIHTGLLHKLLPLCFEYAEVYNKQLIFTTHSSEAINLFQPEKIRLVKMTENGTKVSALDKEQMPFIHDYLKNEGALFDFIKSMNDE